MKKTLREVLALVARGMPALFVCTLPVVLVYLDAVVLGQNCDERGVVEISQSLTLTGIAGCLAAAWARRRDLRGGLALVTAFFVDMLVREQDQVFEMFLPHGVWVFPCAAVTLGAFAWSWPRRAQILPALRAIVDGRAFPVLSLGLCELLVFARLFGGKYVWRPLAGSDDYRLVKHIVEEGLELHAYCILALWAVRFLLETGKETK